MTTAQPRIRDVAREAGVSTGTVSRVLNGFDHVAEHRRAAVLAAVEKLQYRRDPIARALRLGSTNTIGLVVRSLRNQAVAELIERVSDGLTAHGYNVVVAARSYREHLEAAVIDEFMERRYDAVVAINPSSLEPYQRAHEAGTNVAVVMTKSNEVHDFVTLQLDYGVAAEEMFDALYALGHRRVNFIGQPRLAGNTYAAVSALPIVTSGSIELGLVHYAEAARGDVAAILAGRPTALLVRSEEIADVLHLLTTNGVRIPGDVSVAVSGRAPWRTLLSPQLAALEVDYGAVAVALVRTVMQLVRGDERPADEFFVGSYHAAGSIGPAPEVEPARRPRAAVRRA